MPLNWNLVVHCKKDAYDIYVGRPSPFGNPFSHKPSSKAETKVESREEAIDRFEEWVRTQPQLMERIKKELKGKILGCWCRPANCHGDILVKIADE